MRVRLHAIEPYSRANGPGLRTVVWFQGCTLRCPGCYNPGTHEPAGGYEADTEAVTAEILARADGIEGVSISGGEPFQQAEALLELLERLAGSPLSTLVFTGYTLAEIRALPLGPQVLSQVDALVAGPYDRTKQLGRGLLGSANQRLHLLTERHTQGDFHDVPGREVIVHRDGTVTISGIAPWGRE